MNEQITNNYFPSDPNWDYYLAWHQLQAAKAKIDNALNLLSLEEFGDSADQQIKQQLEQALDLIGKTIDNELIHALYEEDEDEENIDE